MYLEITIVYRLGKIEWLVSELIKSRESSDLIRVI